MHDEITNDTSNQTNRGDINQEVDTHFMALVHVNHKLYELDGRKDGPVCHGDTTQECLLKDACRVVKEFMDRDPGEVRFSIIALAPRLD